MLKTSILSVGGLAITMVLSGCGGGDTKTSSSSSSSSAPAKTAKKGTEAKAAGKPWPKDKATASLSGLIKLDGKAPKISEVNLNPECKALHGDKKVMTEEAVVGEKGELANVIVYVTKMPEDYTFDTPTEKKMIDQNGCHYVPHVFGIMVDQELTVRNSDPVNHNINAGADFWNITQPNKEDKTKTFDKAVKGHPIQCNVHPWMKAYVSVFEHPLYAVSGTDGKYTFSEKLVPGKYTLAVWHELEYMKPDNATIEIEVKDGEAKSQDFTFKQD